MTWQTLLGLGADFLASGREIFWFFVLSVVVAAAINALRLDRKVVHFFERAGAWAMLGALLLGLVSPL